MAETVCSFAFLKGMLVRLLFGLHAGACVLRVLYVGDDEDRMWPLYMYSGFAGLMLLDAFWCHCVAKKSWKLFSPTVALYVICTAVCIWFLELKINEVCSKYNDGADNYNCTMTSEKLFPKITLSQAPDLQFLLPLRYSLPEWTEILLQLMMFILIIGRWLLPKGKMSRDQLSQLLLVQIGMAADILELLTEGMLVAQKLPRQMVVWVLIVWSWSLPQFTLSLTMTKTKNPKVSRRQAGEPGHSLKAEKDYHRWRELCCYTEMWSIFLSAILMQDVPFLALRLYLIFSEALFTREDLNSNAIFFSCKNGLVILLQLYRMTVIVSDNQRKKKAWKSVVEKTTSQKGTPKAPWQNTTEAVIITTRPGNCGESAASSVWHTQERWIYFPRSDTGDFCMRRRDIGCQTKLIPLSNAD